MPKLSEILINKHISDNRGYGGLLQMGGKLYAKV